MSRNTVQILLSAVTAFFINAGGACIVVAASGYKLTGEVYVLASIMGLVQAGKDIRSMLHLPEIGEEQVKLAVDAYLTKAQGQKP